MRERERRRFVLEFDLPVDMPSDVMVETINARMNVSVQLPAVKDTGRIYAGEDDNGHPEWGLYCGVVGEAGREKVERFDISKTLAHQVELWVSGPLVMVDEIDALEIMRRYLAQCAKVQTCLGVTNAIAALARIHREPHFELDPGQEDDAIEEHRLGDPL